MTPNLKISQCLINRLSYVKEKCFGCLYGIIYENSLLVLGFISENGSDLSIQDSFPGEIDLCGIIGIGEEDYNSTRAKKLLQDVDVTDNPLFLSCKIGESSKIVANFIVHGKTEQTTYSIYSESDIWSQFVTIRLQTRLPFMCNFQKDFVHEASTTMRKQLASGQVAFHFPNTNVYLMSSDSEHGLTGLPGDPDVEELYNTSNSSTEVSSKSKKKNRMDIDTLQTILFKKATKDSLDGSKNHAPVIDVNKRIYECLTMSLKIDAVAMVHRKTKVLNLYEILIECLCRNLRMIEQCLLMQMNDEKDKKDGDTLCVTLPEPFHFMPDDCGHLITRFYAKGDSEKQLEPKRRALHDKFLLLKKWPYFKRTNAYVFKDEIPSNGPLINPHESLSVSSNANAEMCIVRGKYSYYHYMQQNFDDNGWGCAYRSLQTLFSWFRWQGYTEREVPTHRQIQECLVDIQDKPPNFIGSRQWIGSTEVSFCLETMLGVQSRILHASSGEELGGHGPELAAHFKTQGTPIMIGGGQLAHTILGVEYDQTTGNVRFLVLDPHYTGGEDLHTINGKGWCGWKNLSFWNKTSYYNLCMPQLPRGI